MLSVTIFVFLGWIASVCLHEFGHAIVAYWGGDQSVKDKGYLTLNPLKYTNVSLSLVLPLVFLLLGGIPLPGAAVYINRASLRNRWWESAVSAAGPAASLLVAVLLAIPFQLGLASEAHWIWFALAFLIMLEIAAVVLNLMPIPSLDGYGIIEPWLPLGVRQKFQVVGRYGFLVLFFLLWTVPAVNQAFWTIVLTGSDWLGIPVEMAWIGYGMFTRWAGILLVGLIAVVVVLQRVTRSSKTSTTPSSLPSGQPSEALVAQLDEAIQHQPTKLEFRYARADALSKLQRYEEAILDYEEILRLQSHSPQAWYRKGVVLAHLQRHEAAIAAYDQALKLEPDSPGVLLSQASALQQLERYDEALIAYNRLIRLQPGNATAWAGQGRVLETLHRNEDAIAAYDQALQHQPRDPYLHLSRGRVLGRLQRHEEELTAYDRALNLQPNDAAAWYLRGQVLQDLQRYPEAIEAYDRAVYMQPDYAAAWCQRGVALRQLNQDRRALACFEQAIHIQANDPLAWAEKGRTELKLQNYEGAIAAYEQAIQLEPQNPYFWYDAACSYALSGQPKRAMEQLRQAFALSVDSLKSLARNDSDLAVLRGNTEFQQLVQD